MIKNSEIILGIDPGSLRTGFAIVRKTGNGIAHISHGTIILDKKKDVAERLFDLAKDLVNLIEKYQPDRVILEDIFVYKNARSALVLGQARGVVLGVLGLHNLKVLSLAPTAVKMLVTGQGRAKKFQVAQFCSVQLNISLPTSEDASDALALALAGCTFVRDM